MEPENRIQQVTRLIVMLTTLRNLVQDRFFLTKFDDKINNFMGKFIALVSKTGMDNIAEHKFDSQEFIDSISRLVELINDLKYLNLVEDSILYFQLERDLLGMKLNFLRSIANLKDSESKKETSGVAIKKPQTKEVIKLNSSKQKILDFIKSYPEKRTKEIIYEFNALSDRTVKRSLNELLKAGLIKKRVDNKAAHYS